ncbi:peritrophin-1-like [Anticarsia gemmatalis]|uniref:peritrophin-1-like n=1 Tax=Anticarsia gemmatalis TaxID=129554 RepID=UPI003F763B49
MIGTLFSLALIAAVAVAAPEPTKAKSGVQPYVPFDPEVDPNDMSCDPLGQIFLLLPHWSDCTKFFMCTHGEEVLFTCAGGTIFDFHKQECNWAWAGTCTLRNPPDDEEGSGDEINDNLIGMFANELEQAPVDTVASVRPISPMLTKFSGLLNCNRPDDAARQVPYKGDCQRYWKCISGIPQVAFCSDGLFFNEMTQQCDFEANSKCDATLPEDELQSEFIVYKN